jgi:KDO2-lipid IV(A) lauroyltransferase
MKKRWQSQLGVFILYTIALVPLPILYLISDFFYIVLYKLIKYRTKVVRANLVSAFPNYSPEKRLAIEKAYYKHLCDLIIETVKGFRMSERAFKKRLVINDLSIFDQLWEQEQSAIIVMGHKANWEWACRASPFYFKNRLIGVYKPLSDQVFDETMLKVRTEFGLTHIPMAQIGKYLLQQKTPYLLILLSDQSPSDADSSYWVPFLNQLTAVLPGAEKLALKFKLPVYFTDMTKVKRGHYVCHSHLIADPRNNNYEAAQITALHTEYLEQKIIEQPETWLWSHKRWKLKRSH